MPHVSKALDLAVLKVQRKGAALAIADITTIPIGSKIVAIGNPKGLEGSVSEGIVSGIRDEEGLSIIQITAPISPGSSGGPLFNEKGVVVGITTATIRNAQNLNFAIPAKYLKTLRTKGKAWEPRVKALKAPKIGKAGIEIYKPINDYIPGGRFVFTISNLTGTTIKNLQYAIVFRDTSTGKVLHYEILKETRRLPPGLGTRRELRVETLDYWAVKGQRIYPYSPKMIRGYLVLDLNVLTYEILNEGSPGKGILDSLNR